MTDANQAVQEGEVGALPAESGSSDTTSKYRLFRHEGRFERAGIFASIGMVAFALIVTVPNF
jgi:hypothetical protein